MFYLAAKSFWYVSQPSSLLLLLLVGSLWAVLRQRVRIAAALSAAATLLLVAGGMLGLGALLIAPLEARFTRVDLDSTPVDGVVVLGGGEIPDLGAEHRMHALNEAAERFTEAAALARRLPAARFAFTGRQAVTALSPDPLKHVASKMLDDLGLEPGRRLAIEFFARDTWENAVLARSLLQPKPGERWLLVTSAWHMPRAVGVFRAAGFPVEAWPVDFRSHRRRNFWRVNDSVSDGLRLLDTAAREWVGLVAYRLAGRTDTLLPAP